MPSLLFPDNTVLVNFGLIDRMDELDKIVNGNGQWCATVATECKDSASVDGLSAMSAAAGIFGSPIYPNRSELQLTQIFREKLASPGDSKRRHLGEAETLAVMVGRSIKRFFVTDDLDALRFAASQEIKGLSSWDLFRVGLRKEILDPQEFFGELSILREHKRRVPREIHDYPSLVKWYSPSIS